METPAALLTVRALFGIAEPGAGYIERGSIFRCDAARVHELMAANAVELVWDIPPATPRGADAPKVLPTPATRQAPPKVPDGVIPPSTAPHVAARRRR